MSQILIDKIRNARQTRVEAGGFTFICRRPTYREAQEMKSKGVTGWELLDRFILGWEGVKESDIVSSGDSSPAEFSPELCAEWLADRPQMWEGISDAILNEYKSYVEKLAEAEKK
jgi:hypothetical protein